MWKKATAVVVGGTLIGVGAFAISYLNSPRVEDKLGGTFEELFVPPPPEAMKKVINFLLVFIVTESKTKK